MCETKCFHQLIYQLGFLGEFYQLNICSFSYLYDCALLNDVDNWLKTEVCKEIIAYFFF